MEPGQEQHLPHEAWHVVQQGSRRRRATLPLKGAEILGYSSPTNDTDKRFPDWKIEVSQGNYEDLITPYNNPLQTPGLSGEFQVRVFVRCPETGEYLLWKDKEGNETGVVGVGENCIGMVIFYALAETGCEGTYYTVYNAVCGE